MLKDIVSAKSLGGHRLHLRFEDGVEGIVDLGSILSFRCVSTTLRQSGRKFTEESPLDLGVC